MRDLVEKARAGDHEAFSELGRLCVDKLYAIAFLILRDQERAGDATQEALVACWRDIRGLRDPDHFDSWLVGSSSGRATERPAGSGSDDASSCESPARAERVT